MSWDFSLQRFRQGSYTQCHVLQLIGVFFLLTKFRQTVSPLFEGRPLGPFMHFVDVRDELEDVSSTRPLKTTKRQRSKQHLVPGKLLAAGDQELRRQRAPIAGHAVIRHEPVDYLALRRTELSKRALLRNREAVVQEILSPTTRVKRRAPDSKSTQLLDRIAALEHSEPSFLRHEPNVVAWQPVATDSIESQHLASLTLQMHKLKQAQVEAVQAQDRQEDKVRGALNEVRNAVSSMYTFTPTFRIWSRTKTKSALELWQRYVVWHREEEARLIKLTHFAVRIQHAFRCRRGRLLGFIERAAIRQAKWAGATRLQCWIRGVFAREEAQRLRESVIATRLQRVWRGRVGRRRVKNRLRDILRTRLRYLSPTGSLHRLRDIAMYDEMMREMLERMLGLVEEVEVSFDGIAFATSDNSKAELKISEWYNAIRELEALIEARQVEIQQAKRHFEAQRALRLAAVRIADAKDKADALEKACERVHRANELIAMYREDCEAHERVRTEKANHVDAAYREALRVRRAEKDACMAMQREEMETRHIVAELRWREADRRLRMGEVDKVEWHRQMEEEAAAERMKEWITLMMNKQAAMINLQEEQKIKRAQHWKIKTENMLERQKAIKKQLKRQRQQEEHERFAALERTRLERLAELHKQEIERYQMENEDKLLRALMSEAKKAEEAKLWETIRIEANKAKPDPMMLEADVVAERQQIERERQNCIMMAFEEKRMRMYMAQVAKEMYLKECKDRKHRFDAERKAEAKANNAMQAEEAYERGRLKKLADKAVFEETLKRMQAADEAFKAKQAEKLFEARCRKLMHDEEMRLHRLYTEVLHRERLRERKERHLMHNDELYMRHILDERERLRLRRLEKTHRVEMAVEDVRSHQWHALEKDGTQIALVLITHPGKECSGYHLAPTTNKTVTTRAQELWDRIRNKYLKRTIAANEARRGAQELEAGYLIQAQRTLRMAFRDEYKGARLVRNIAKCYIKLYEAYLNTNDLRMGVVWYLKASDRLECQGSPSFLDEMAHALYLIGRFQYAAEVLGRIIFSFPTYANMATVIFRSATLMWHLGLYEQSTEYLLHLLESPPPPWNDLDIMFFIARLYILDDNKSHAAFAYDDALRRYRLHGNRFDYPSWKSWASDAAVWRHFGAKALAAGEYLIAKDMYQQAIKRRHEEVYFAHRQKERELDWFFLAQCQVMLHENVSANATMVHWLESKHYVYRVLERLQEWPSEKWKSIGVEPIMLRNQETGGKRSAEKTNETPIMKKKRKQLGKLRKKRIRRQRRRIKYTTTAELQNWVQLEDLNSGKIFFFNEKTFDVTWTRPT
ncbi:hypothetical protein Ae201684P_003255 [Aphanomyces euteiches]|nr:hypothetical protein Ae201684P_003255 [Aphanomyces euteiches]